MRRCRSVVPAGLGVPVVLGSSARRSGARIAETQVSASSRVRTLPDGIVTADAGSVF